jgi:hypothetical protein
MAAMAAKTRCPSALRRFDNGLTRLQVHDERACRADSTPTFAPRTGVMLRYWLLALDP